jgi:ribosomal-protein-alanine N-acetyltransferase
VPGASALKSYDPHGMPVSVELKTARLLLRPWHEADRIPFAALNADPEVMRYFPAPLTRGESDAMVDSILDNFARRGWGLWAVEVTDVAPFIGFVGLNPANFDAPFTPCVEVGWRLAKEHWGHGYASEAARVAVQFGFAGLELDEIFSWTATVNLPSRAVMERIGMTHDPAEDFEHPRVAVGHWLRPHVLYRLPRAAVRT